MSNTPSMTTAEGWFAYYKNDTVETARRVVCWKADANGAVHGLIAPDPGTGSHILTAAETYSGFIRFVHKDDVQ